MVSCCQHDKAIKRQAQNTAAQMSDQHRSQHRRGKNEKENSHQQSSSIDPCLTTGVLDRELPILRHH